MSAHDLFFWAFALVACGAAVAVVVSQNVVRMAFWLVISLASMSGLFFLLHADLIGAAQLLIYAGGTLVLLVFGVMLTASGPFLSMKTNPGEAVLSGVIGVSLLGLILYSAGSVDWTKVSPPPPGASRTLGATEGAPVGHNAPVVGNSTRPIGFSLLGLRPDKDLGGVRSSVGYLLPFEIVSVHLLVVLVGAAYLARAKRKKRRDIDAPEVM